MKDKLFISWMASAVLFALSSIPFFVGFFFTMGWEILYFVACLVPMALFGIIYFKFDKQMRERKECSKYEYVYFYKKCKDAGVVSGFQLNDGDKDIIIQCGKKLTYFVNMEDDVLIETYRKGLKEYRKKENQKK